MLLLKRYHSYQLILPNQYHKSNDIKSIETLDRFFYLTEDPLYYRNSLRNYVIYNEPQYYELRMRGCLVHKQALKEIDGWSYIDVLEDTDQTISHYLLQYLSNRSVLKAVIIGRSNQFFSLMPLQCIYQFLVGLTFEEFKVAMSHLTTIVTILDLKTCPLIHSQQISTNCAGYVLNECCQKLLIKHNLYFFEDLQAFDWFLLANMPSMNECKVAKMQEFYTQKSSSKVPQLAF